MGRKLTTEEFISRARKVHNNKYDYSETNYINYATKVKIKCNICGNYFYQYPYDHLNGHGCPFCANKQRSKSQKLTKEEFINRAKKIHGDKYDYTNIIYNGWNDYVENIKCNRCGRIFKQKAKYHLKSSGCPNCSKPNKLTTEEFIKRVEQIYGKDIFDFSKTNYVNKKTDVIVICKKHNHEIKVKPYVLLKGSKVCPYCMFEENNFRGVKLTKEVFIARANKVHNNKFDYLFDTINNVNEKIKVKCKICGHSYEILAYTHLQGYNCPKCSSLNSRLTQEEFLNRLKNIPNSELFDFSNVNYQGMKNSIEIKCNICSNTFKTLPVYFLQYPYCPHCKRTKFENDVISYVKDLLDKNVKIILNFRQILDNYEIDIYLPKYKLGIECHGIYWHSLHKNNKNNWSRLRKLHKIKSDLADKYNIQLLQIFEHEWYDSIKQNIWKDIIKTKLGLIKNKIYARKCKIIALTNKETKEFLDKYHLHGHINATYNYGLIFNDEIVAVATFGKHRFNKNKNNNRNVYELYRFAVKNDLIIPGGFSKLIHYFIKQVKPSKLITYSDRRYSSIHKNVYYSSNFFKFIGTTNPNYWYLKLPLINNNYDKITVLNRLNFQKHKLKDLLPNFNPNMSEIENMVQNDYFVMFDAGNYIFEMQI